MRLETPDSVSGMCILIIRPTCTWPEVNILDIGRHIHFFHRFS